MRKKGEANQKGENGTRTSRTDLRLKHESYGIWKAFNTQLSYGNWGRPKSSLVNSITPEELISKEWNYGCWTLHAIFWSYMRQNYTLKCYNMLKMEMILYYIIAQTWQTQWPDSQGKSLYMIIWLYIKCKKTFWHVG